MIHKRNKNGTSATFWDEEETKELEMKAEYKEAESEEWYPRMKRIGVLR